MQSLSIITEMEKIKSDSVYIALKSIVYVLAIMGLIFFANFWLGTQDGFEDMVETSSIRRL